MAKLDIGTLILYKDYAREEYLKLSRPKLKGTTRPLSEPEIVAISYYRASLRILNKLDAFKQGWPDAGDFELVVPDSEPDADD